MFSRQKCFLELHGSNHFEMSKSPSTASSGMILHYRIENLDKDKESLDHTNKIVVSEVCIKQDMDVYIGLKLVFSRVLETYGNKLKGFNVMWSQTRPLSCHQGNKYPSTNGGSRLCTLNRLWIATISMTDRPP